MMPGALSRGSLHKRNLQRAQMGDASDCVILEDGTELLERLARMPGVPVDSTSSGRVVKILRRAGKRSGSERMNGERDHT
jgi:hypothetical protein